MPVDRDKLRELTERIQVGDTDEGADALQEIVSLVRTEERGDARMAVRQELADLRLKSEHDAALGKFAKRYPKLTKDPVLVEAGAHVLRDELVRDLRAVGVTDDELKPIRENVGQLAGLHGKARLMGREGVRSAEKLLDDVGGVLSEKFNLKPAGTGRSPEEYVRDLRRDRGLNVRDDSSGRREGSRAPGSSTLAAEQQDRTSRAIQQMREARGFAARAPR